MAHTILAHCNHVSTQTCSGMFSKQCFLLVCVGGEPYTLYIVLCVCAVGVP